MRPGARSSSVENVLARRAGVAGPDVDDARADLDPLGGRGERRHRHDGVADEPAVGLPHGVEPGRLGLLGRARCPRGCRGRPAGTARPGSRQPSGMIAQAGATVSGPAISSSAPGALIAHRAVRAGEQAGGLLGGVGPDLVDVDAGRAPVGDEHLAVAGDDVDRPDPGRERHVPRRVDVVVAPRHAVVGGLGEEPVAVGQPRPRRVGGGGHVVGRGGRRTPGGTPRACRRRCRRCRARRRSGRAAGRP